MADQDPKDPNLYRTRSAGFESELLLDGSDILLPPYMFPGLPKRTISLTRGSKKYPVERSVLTTSELAGAIGHPQHCHKLTFRPHPKGYRPTPVASLRCSAKQHKDHQRDPVYRLLSQQIL